MGGSTGGLEGSIIFEIFWIKIGELLDFSWECGMTREMKGGVYMENGMKIPPKMMKNNKWDLPIEIDEYAKLWNDEANFGRTFEM